MGKEGEMLPLPPNVKKIGKKVKNMGKRRKGGNRRKLERRGLQ